MKKIFLDKVTFIKLSQFALKNPHLLPLCRVYLTGKHGDKVQVALCYKDIESLCEYWHLFGRYSLAKDCSDCGVTPSVL